MKVLVAGLVIVAGLYLLEAAPPQQGALYKAAYLTTTGTFTTKYFFKTFVETMRLYIYAANFCLYISSYVQCVCNHIDWCFAFFMQANLTPQKTLNACWSDAVMEREAHPGVPVTMSVVVVETAVQTSLPFAVSSPTGSQSKHQSETLRVYGATLPCSL